MNVVNLFSASVWDFKGITIFVELRIKWESFKALLLCEAPLNIGFRKTLNYLLITFHIYPHRRTSTGWLAQASSSKVF